MRTIFDYINDILVFKRGNLLDNIDNESTFNPYLINRWISMYSPEYCNVINITTNRLYSIFETKQQQYNFLVSIIPQTHQKRINYIKKQKPDNKQQSYKVAIKKLAEAVELSEREINDYVETGLINIQDYVEVYEKN